MRRALAAAVVLGALGLFPAGASAATKRCGAIARVGEAGTELVIVRAEGVSCRTAR